MACQTFANRDGPPVWHIHSMHWLHSVSKSLTHVTTMYSADCQWDLLLNNVLSSLTDHTFLTDMQDAVWIHLIKTTCKEPIDPQMLAGNWGIGIKTAKQTLKVTTQCRVQTILHPTLSWWFQTNDGQLWYDHLPVDLFTDTMFLKQPSLQGSKCTSLFDQEWLGVDIPDEEEVRGPWCSLSAFPMWRCAQCHGYGWCFRTSTRQVPP